MVDQNPTPQNPEQKPPTPGLKSQAGDPEQAPAIPVQPTAPVAPQPPVAPAPVATAPVAPAQPVQAVQSVQAAPQSPKTPEQLLAEKKVLKEKQKKKRLLYVLLGSILFVFFAVFLVVFYILSQGGGSNPLLQLFGLSEEELYPFLINIANLFFGLFDFIAFILAVIGAFLTAMAKKEDKEAKKRGVTLLIIGMLFFVLFSITWAGSYFYLQQKKAQYATQGAELEYIVTNPEDTTQLTAPAVVEFDASNLPVDTNRFTIISYRWDFADGSTATGPKVSHRYTTKGEDDGRYIVELTVLYRDNKSSEEASEVFTVDVIFVNEKVNAFFAAEPASGEIPLAVHFDASDSADPDGEIVGYEWDLDGDGDYDDGSEVEMDHTYDQYGTYTVKLRVTDNNGESNVMTFDIEATPAARPTAVIQVDLEDNGTLYVGKSYVFSAENATSPNGSVQSYEWDFGDGKGGAKNKTAQHTYEKPGTYPVTLLLSDEEEETGEVSLEVKVVNAESMPTAVITTDQPWENEEENSIRGTVPFVVSFSAKESSDSDENIVDYKWDVNSDEAVDDFEYTSVGETVEYTYQEAGIYQVVLIVEDAEGNQSQATIQVIVEQQGLIANVTADPLYGEVPLTVSFDASGSTYTSGKIVNYLWDFGNDVTRYDTARVQYTFSEVGPFTVIVTAIASDGKESKDTILINVLPVSVSACFTVNSDSGKAPLTVTFNPSCSTGTVTSYRWDFDDGEISYARKPTHTFEQAGTYKVKLTVEDTDGVTADYEMTIAVQSS